MDKTITVLHKESKNRKARSIRITLHKDGRVVVTRPSFVAQEKAEAFLKKKSDWIEKHMRTFRTLTPIIPKYTKKEVAGLKTGLLRKVLARVEHFNRHYNFKFNRISIRDTKSRWGSCSRKGNLQFSFKMNYIPDHLFDYVIVHELCHLKEFNHGEQFWNAVGETLPNHKILRAELRRII